MTGQTASHYRVPEKLGAGRDLPNAPLAAGPESRIMGSSAAPDWAARGAQ